jgi:hypothetical protein
MKNVCFNVFLVLKLLNKIVVKLSNGFVSKKKNIFLRLFCSYRKKKQLCRRNFLISSPFSLRKLNLKTQFLQQHYPFLPFWEQKKEQPLFLNFQIEFSRRKRARIEKISSTKLFLLAIRIK